MPPRHAWLLSPLLALLVCAPSPAAEAGTPTRRATHVLNRLAFGPRPGEVAQLAASDVDRYLAAQLHPEALAEPEALTRRLAELETLRQAPSEIYLATEPPT